MKHLEQFLIFLLAMVIISLGLIIIPGMVFYTFKIHNVSWQWILLFVCVYSIAITAICAWANPDEFK